MKFIKYYIEFKMKVKIFVFLNEFTVSMIMLIPWVVFRLMKNEPSDIRKI